MPLGRVRQPARMLAVFLTLAAAAQASRLTGRVFDGSGDPVEGAFVQASSGQPPEVVAQAETNANGQYAMDAPAGLLAFSVKAHGYYVLNAGGLDSETITKTCPEQGACGEIEFRLGKFAVVEGWVADRFGDPVAGVPLVLRPEGEPETPQAAFDRRGFRPPRFTDDRGYFRIWDLRPGQYILESDSRMRMFPGRERSFEFPSQKVEVREQGETVDLHISASSEGGSHTLSGVVEGAPRAAGVQLARSERGMISITSHHSLRGGRFSMSGVATGDYLLRMIEYDFEKQDPKVRLLDHLHVDRDMTDLRLSPQPPTGVRLTADFGDAPPGNLFVHLRPANGGFADMVSLRKPDYATTNEGVAPGEYDVVLFSEEYYLVAPDRITVRAGQIAPYTLTVGNEFSSLRGRVRVAEGADRAGAAHFTVGVRGSWRRLKMQADEDGRFAFDKLAPGDYEVAAWSKPDVDVENDDIWAEAAGSASKVQIEPGFDVEINLTASP